MSSTISLKDTKENLIGYNIDIDEINVSNKINYTSDNNIKQINQIDNIVNNSKENVDDNHYEISIKCKENAYNDEIIEIQDQYRELATKIGTKWGVSPNLVLGMLTQESHGTVSNLMQIQSYSILDEVMTVYNFNTKEYVSYVVTKNPSKYSGNITTITPSELNNNFTNISVAIIIYRHILNEYAKGNPIAAIEIYNKGIGNFNRNLKEASKVTGKSVENILSNIEDISFLDFSYACNAGDSNYVANIMQYVAGDIEIKMLNENNEEYTISYTINKTKEKELKR